VLVAAALCPAPPLLARELTGADPVVPDLRAACLDAAAGLVAARPGIIAVVGTAGQAQAWDPAGRLDLAAFAPALRAYAGGPGSTALPVSLGLGCMLLDHAGHDGQRLLRSVTPGETAADCAVLGSHLAGLTERVALLVMADGSACRTLKAPGYLDERSAPFDAQVEGAVRRGDLDALLTLDADLAADLMATGRPALQVLAGAASGRPATSAVRFRDDPFGVFYLVASLIFEAVAEPVLRTD
jgi:hypothetical protein